MTRSTWIVLGPIAAAGAWLRFFGLEDRCLWLDEALSWRMASFPFAEIVGRNTGPYDADNPPFYFMLLRAWMGCWGDTETALRSLSALAGVAGILAMYLFARELGRFAPAGSRLARPAVANRAGVLAAALMAGSEVQVLASRQARMYSLGALLFVASSWALLRALRGKGAGPAWWVGYGLLATAFCYTHILALFCVVAQFLFAAAYLGAALRSSQRLGSPAARPAPEPGRGPMAGRRLRWFVLTGLGMGAAYLPELLVLLGRYHSAGGANIWMGRLGLISSSRQALEAFFSIPVSHYLVQSSFGCFAGLVAVGLVYALLVRQGWAGVYLLGVGLVPAGLMLFYSATVGTSLIQSRYLTFVQAGWLAALSVGLVGLPRPVALPAAAAAAGVWLCLGLSTGRTIVASEARPGMRAVVAHIASLRRPNEPILVQSPWSLFKLAYYQRGGPRPLLCSVNRSRHLQAQIMYLEDDEIVRPDYLSATGAAGFWLVSSSSYGEREGVHFPLPGRWVRRSSERYAQDYLWERPVAVEHYGKRSGP